MKKQAILLSTLVFSLLIFLVYYKYDIDKATILKKDIISIQSKYREFLSEDLLLSDEDLTLLSKKDFFKSHRLSKLYNKLQKAATTNISDTINELEDEFVLLKKENITYYSSSNNLRYKELLKENDSYIEKIKTNFDVSLVDLFEKNNNILIEIVIEELKIDDDVTKVYRDSINNINTKSEVIENCFKSQINDNWMIDEGVSKEYCNFLNLKNCSVDYDKNNSSLNNFIGYTLNNPKLLSPLKSYEYVSYFKNEYNRNEITEDLLSNPDNNVYVEVYKLVTNNREIFKYNIISIPKTYQLSCKQPLPVIENVPDNN